MKSTFSIMTNKDYKALRLSYKPPQIKVLYVGESRPQNGTFFYLGNSILYKAIADGVWKASDRKT